MFTKEGYGAINKYENLRHDLSHKSCHKLNLINNQSQNFAPYIISMQFQQLIIHGLSQIQLAGQYL